MSKFLQVVALSAALSWWGGFPNFWGRFLLSATPGVSQPGGEFPDHSACVDPEGGSCFRS